VSGFELVASITLTYVIGFSPANSPHLTPALELDNAILAFSATLEAQGLPKRISSPQDIETILSALSNVLKTLNLWQYYVLDPATQEESVAAALKSDSLPEWTGSKVAGKAIPELAVVIRAEGKLQNISQCADRFGVTIDPKVAASFVKAAFNDLHDPQALAEAWREIVSVINVPLYEEYDDDFKVILANIKNRVTYTRLDANGPKLGEISERWARSSPVLSTLPNVTLFSSPLVESYFTRLTGPATSQKDPASLALANNGWIWNADPLQNFALLPSKSYLRREVIVWGDCVKLRYGTGRDDNPWLWDYMTSYVQSLAEMFDGFRIDNCHSTPLHGWTRPAL
jgi:glycogen debranching enzyme